MATNGYNNGHLTAYHQANATVNQVQQVVMLYDGAINFIKQAKEAINEKNYEKRYNLINRAIAIVTGLNSCLNFTEKTQETAKALDDFYSSIDMRLLYIQCDNSLESCDKVIEDLRIMREAWSDVVKQTAGNLTNTNNIDNIEISSNRLGETPTEPQLTNATQNSTPTPPQVEIEITV